MTDILRRMPHNSTGPMEIWVFCKRIYEKNGAQWKYIDKLRTTYDAGEAIQYYTGNSCLSRTANQVCRTENFQHIYSSFAFR